MNKIEKLKTKVAELQAKVNKNYEKPIFPFQITRNVDGTTNPLSKEQIRSDEYKNWSKQSRQYKQARDGIFKKQLLIAQLKLKVAEQEEEIIELKNFEKREKQQAKIEAKKAKLEEQKKRIEERMQKLEA